MGIRPGTSIRRKRGGASIWRTMSPVTPLLARLGLGGAVLGRDLAIAVGIQPVEESLPTLRRKLAVKLSVFELLKTHAATLVPVQFPKPPHPFAPVPGRAGHSRQFFPAELPVGVFIETLEQVQPLFLRQVFHPQHGMEFIQTDRPVLVLICLLPRGHEPSMFPLFPTTARVVRASLHLRPAHGRQENSRNK